MLFLCALCALLLFTLAQPLLPGQKDAIKIYTNEAGRQLRNTPPGAEFWFGTNAIGQDLWSRIWSGTRASMLIGVAVGMVDALMGVLVGAMWGYVRKMDRVITEVYNVIQNVPETIILILVAYILRPGIGTIIFAMCITGWLPTARYVRNQIIIIRDREFNLASRCLGTPTSRIITRNLLPQLVSVIMMRAALAIPIAIGHEVFLTYIGLGLPVSTPSLGNLVNEGRIVMMSPSLRYQLLYPSLILSLITISFYIIGNSFADAADPKNHL
jgi:oligopeptide transport system permease protein